MKRLLAVVLGLVPAAGEAAGSGWTLTRQAETPTLYALAENPSTNLNVRAVVLACETMGTRKVLQLQLYPARPEPILPRGATRDALKDQPRAEIEIDGVARPIEFDAAGDFAVLHDSAAPGLAALSPALAAAIENAHTVVVHFDLVQEAPGQPPAFDGRLALDPTAGEGRAALATVRRECGA